MLGAYGQGPTTEPQASWVRSLPKCPGELGNRASTGAPEVHCATTKRVHGALDGVAVRRPVGAVERGVDAQRGDHRLLGLCEVEHDVDTLHGAGARGWIRDIEHQRISARQQLVHTIDFVGQFLCVCSLAL